MSTAGSHSEHTDASTRSRTPRPATGGGPLTAIGSDDNRPDGQRALAASLVELLRVQRSAHARKLATADGSQLSMAQFRCAIHLPSTGSMTARELATAAHMTPASVSQMLDGLEAAGIVHHERSSSDRRTLEVRLTPAGHDTLHALQSSYEQHWDALMHDLTDEDLATTARVLDRVSAMFDDWQRDPTAD